MPWEIITLADTVVECSKAVSTVSGSRTCGSAARPSYFRVSESVGGKQWEGVGVFLDGEKEGAGESDGSGASRILSSPFKTSPPLSSSQMYATKIGPLCPKRPIGDQAMVQWALLIHRFSACGFHSMRVSSPHLESFKDLPVMSGRCSEAWGSCIPPPHTLKGLPNTLERHIALLAWALPTPYGFNYWRNLISMGIWE